MARGTHHASAYPRDKAEHSSALGLVGRAGFEPARLSAEISLYRRMPSTGLGHLPIGGGCRNRTCVRFISVCRVSSAVPCHWANPPHTKVWRKRGDSNPYALSVRWFSGPESHQLLVSSVWSAVRDSNSVRAELQSAASSTSASGALSKNLVAEERVELSCPKALVPKTSVSPGFTTRPNCFWELNYSKSAVGMITPTLD